MQRCGRGEHAHEIRGVCTEGAVAYAQGQRLCFVESKITGERSDDVGYVLGNIRAFDGLAQLLPPDDVPLLLDLHKVVETCLDQFPCQREQLRDLDLERVADGLVLFTLICRFLVGLVTAGFDGHEPSIIRKALLPLLHEFLRTAMKLKERCHRLNDMLTYGCDLDK